MQRRQAHQGHDRRAVRVAEHAAATPDAAALTGKVRVALSRMIVQNIIGSDDSLPVMTLDPTLEQLLQQSGDEQSGAMGFEPGMAERLHKSLTDAAGQREGKGEPAILLVPAAIRTGISRWLKHSLPNLHVLSYSEVPQDKQIKIVATVGA